MSLVADALRVLPDVTPSTSPEVLVKFELNDESEGTTLAPSVIPATPPLLGLSNPFITMDTVVYQESTGSASVESSASSSPSAKQFGDTIYSSASTSSIQTNQLALGPFESAELRLSISGDSESEVSLRRSDQENIWPAPALDLPDRITRAFSRRQMASGVIDQRLQLDLPVLSSSFSDCGYGFEAGSLGLSGNAFPYLDCYSQTGEPITPIDQVLHTPEFPPQVARYDSIQTTQDVAHVTHLPRRLSYSYDSALPLRTPVPYSCVSEHGSSANTLGDLELGPPAVIRPFYFFDFQCSAAGSPPQPPLAELATTSLHGGTLSQ